MADEPPTETFDRLHAGLAEKIGSLFQPPAVADNDLSGRQIGPYKLLQRIGTGGFGDVYMAEQQEPVRRRVAIKIIKLGMDTKQVIARFEAERQALAMMDHPNIARVLDAAATETGRPYFVMELVKGEPITAYCDREKLTIADRLDLFSQVCHAVQHAHQKAVIHRDIKPSNVLVSTVDGRPMAKVIDFGIAKATDHRLTEKTLFTAFHQMIGTPEYMSPEQVGGSNDIDTRTDIYSLGVLLYELLTGTPPFAPGQLRSAAYAEMQRIIREVEPPKPSVRLSGSQPQRRSTAKRNQNPAPSRSESYGSSVEDVAQLRRTEPTMLLRAIRGELDWIVMKCLDKDRARRYETAAALAMDINRHLNAQPVVAAPPSKAYRFRKFVRRHRAGMVGGILVSVSLIAGIAGTTTFAVREARARQSADERRKETDLVAQFQSSQLSGIDMALMGVRLRRCLIDKRRGALAARGSDEATVEAGVRELEDALSGVNFTNVALETLDENIFKRALTAIEKDFADQPLIKASLLQTVSETLRRLGLRHRAMPPQQEALRIRRESLGDEHPDTLTSISSLGELLDEQGEFAEAEQRYRETLEGRRHVLAHDHPDTLNAMNDMGSVLQDQGKLAEAEPYYREALAGMRRVLGNDHPRTLNTINNMGALLAAKGKLTEAERYHREALNGRRRMLGNEHPDTLMSINNMGSLLVTQGRLTEAEPYFREALETERRILGDDHPDTLLLLNNMGFLLQAQGKLAEAEPYFRIALENSRGLLGEDHPERLGLINNLGALLKARGKLTEAEPYYREALARRRRVLGDDHPETLISMNNMGALLAAQDKPAEAAAYYQEALDRRRRVLGPDHPETLLSLNNLGSLLQDQGKLAEAEPYYREALIGRRRVLGNEHPDTLYSMYQMGTLFREMKRFQDAETLLLEAEAGVERLPPTHQLRPRVLESLMKMYDAWRIAEPNAGHEAQFIEWQTELAACQTSMQSARERGSVPTSGPPPIQPHPH